MSQKILVVDESPTIHKIVAMAFEGENIMVEGISRGEHALEFMVEYQPKIVLADIHLPGMDGYELCRQIKNSPLFGTTRVILLTSDFEDIDQVELEISRADDYISKPFKTEEILKKVKSQLNIPDAEGKAQVKKTKPSQEPENNNVIQNEVGDIINQPKESTSDPVKELFIENQDPKSPMEEIELETDTPSKPQNEESRQKKPLTDDPHKNKVPPAINADIPEKVVRAETRPIRVKTDDLNSVFQSILASPDSGLEDTPKPKPGSKPNLIDETLSFMARQQIEEEPEADPNSKPIGGEAQRTSGDPDDHSLGNKIIKEHLDQLVDRIPEDVRLGSSHVALEKTVREVLGEVAPKIIRKVIQEEIESIKKMKES